MLVGFLQGHAIREVFCVAAFWSLSVAKGLRAYKGYVLKKGIFAETTENLFPHPQ